ncbi:uncharacterized protein LOC124353075 [Homalodisca vitripennis]|uniref:uncharacterized protein LOC124353075 n=1 Tax=Homalodisca vitripennis TaxID=197043 RepID=UPI001EEA0981|nr:uncharacterized protein LOC124353075 [Homalodisca vitripennis]
MLSLARNHSPLYILQATTDLVDLDHHRLLDLLLELEGPNSWNVQVFEGFTILFSVFQILEKGVDIFNEYEKEDNDCDLMCLKYKEEVSKPISDLDKSLNKLEPLDFRLEVLEDIFLLLFLRSEDYCEEKDCVDSSAEEPEEGHNLLSRSASDSGALEPHAPTTSRRKSSPGRASSTSSYPSTTTTQRRSASHRRSNKSFAVKFSQGFVCYPWLVSDILGCLKRSLEHLETVCDHFGCDRFKRLKGSVDDAAWRLAMVSDSSSGISRDVHSRVEACWVYEGGDSSDSDDTPSLPPSPRRKGRRSRHLESSSRSESSSNATFGPKFSSSASVTSSVKTRRCSRLFSTSSNLINLMLASPSCLVSYFIAKEDLDRATNAVERFNLRGTAVNVELNFLKEFSNLRNNILEVDVRNSDEKSSIKNSTLQAISETTSSGVLNVTLTKLVETFLIQTPLPEEVGDNKGVVVLDLALSPLPSLKHSICLLDLARTYTRTALASPVKGTVEAFTQTMRRVVDEIDDSSSLTDILLDPCVPLRDANKISNLRKFWSSLQECLSSFQSSMTSADDDLADAAFLKLTSCIVVGQGLVQNYQDDTKEHFLNHLRSYVTCLWKIVSHKIPAGTKYKVLEYDLDTLVGELVFSEGKDPLEVETALEPVSINVIHLVMAHCTPSISIRQLKQRPATIVLNSCHQTCESKGGLNVPEEVSSLLSKLLDTIEWKSSRALADLPTSPRVQEVLAATCCLQQLDWNQLVPGDQLFAFLVNLYNLMWLHALILLEISDEYGLVSPSACLRDLSAQSVGYIVGECYR